MEEQKDESDIRDDNDYLQCPWCISRVALVHIKNGYENDTLVTSKASNFWKRETIIMGLYLDSPDSYTLYKKIHDSKWYIDKTEILSELIDRIGTTENYICVTRPRRFGKTVAANMIAAYFSQNLDSRELFDGSKIAELFDGVAAIEKEHEERYRKLLKNVEDKLVFSRDGDCVWQCSNCGHIVIGKEAPEVCPVCNHPRDYFQLKAENY